MLNYAPSDEVIFIDWENSPELSDQESKIFFAPENAIMSIEAGALATLTEYQIKVTVRNSMEEKAQTTHTYEFKTGALPSGGTVTVEPESGIVANTTFTFKISDWKIMKEAEGVD